MDTGMAQNRIVSISLLHIGTKREYLTDFVKIVALDKTTPTTNPLFMKFLYAPLLIVQPFNILMTIHNGTRSVNMSQCVNLSPNPNEYEEF